MTEPTHDDGAREVPEPQPGGSGLAAEEAAGPAAHYDSGTPVGEVPAGEVPAGERGSDDDGDEGRLGEIDALTARLAERTDDLQRLQAEYVNYRKRVDRDRAVASELAVVAVVEGLVPVLDDIDSARAHGDVEGTPLAAIAGKLESVLERFGWQRYGAEGEAFDPQVHEALMHVPTDGVAEPTVSAVLRPGHRLGERVVRAAQVAVADAPG